MNFALKIFSGVIYFVTFERGERKRFSTFRKYYKRGLIYVNLTLKNADQNL